MARPIERRQFLAGAISVGAVGLVKSPLPLAAHGPERCRTRRLAAAARSAAATAATTRTLVLLTLYGGNDGLNTVVPYEDPAYNSNRGNIAIAPDKLLSDRQRLWPQPRDAGLQDRVGRRPAGDRRGRRVSRAQPQPLPVDGRLAERIDLGRRGSGWLGRWLDRTGHSPLQACSIGPTVLPAMAGNRTEGSGAPGQHLPGLASSPTPTPTSSRSTGSSSFRSVRTRPS